MNQAPYENAPIRIRDDLAAAHRRAWDHLAQPGTWWGGDERVALAAETRNAVNCRLCRQRKEALSPAAVSGSHDNLGELPENAVEVVHRIRTDPARLTRSWFEGVMQSGLTPDQYVEIVSVGAHVVSVDTFARGLGISPLPLPCPASGTPTEKRPSGAKPGPAWVPWIEPADLMESEADIYPRARASEHPQSDEPRAGRSEELLRSVQAPISGNARDARFRPGIPRHHACSDRALGGARLGLEPMFLLNDQPRATAPCEQPA